MRLSKGQRAPDFDAIQWRGDNVRLHDYLTGPVWLAFFRYASCPLCNLRVHEMRARYQGWREAGLQVLCVFQSTPERVESQLGEQSTPFPLICDPEEALYATYGLERSLAGFLAPSNTPALVKAMSKGYWPGAMDGTKTRLPADFLIDAEGIIQELHYARRIGEHISFSRVDRFVDEYGKRNVVTA